jgi:hypothetical protein
MTTLQEKYESRPLEYSDGDRRIIFNWILEKLDGMRWHGLDSSGSG